MNFESMIDTDGNWIPVHLCDCCFQPILEISRGLVEWQELAPTEDYQPGIAEIRAFHKKCFREYPRTDDPLDYRTMELSHFWESFLESAPFNSYDRKQAMRTLNLLRRIA